MRIHPQVCAFLAASTALAGCGRFREEPGAVVLDTADGETTMFLALAEPTTNAPADHLYISSVLGTEAVSLCEDRGSACAGEELIPAEKRRDTSDRTIFRSSRTVPLRDGLMLRIEAKKVGLDIAPLLVRIEKVGGQNPGGDLGTPGDYDWRADITLVEIASHAYSGNTYGSAYFKDVMTHVKSPYLEGGPMTSVHESLHFLLHENARANAKFIYQRDGKGAFLPEAATKTGVIEPYIPRSIVSQAKLYNTYIKPRPDQVLGENIFDEWKAYIVETHALIESTRAGTPVTNDSVEGASTEFLYYAAVALHVLAEKEPAHLAQPNVKAVFAMLAEESRWIYDNLTAMGELKSERTKAQFDHLRSSPESEAIRESLKSLYGSTWTMRVLGF